MKCRRFRVSLVFVIGVLIAPGLAGPAWGGEQPARRGDPSATVRVVFVGDLMLDRLPGAAVAKGGDPFARYAALFDEADIVVGNLECVLASGGEPVPKPYNFRCEPRALPWLERYFDAVSLANNHTGDFGRGALVEMLDRLGRSKVRAFGAGRTLKDAHRPLILERKGQRFALLGYNEFQPRSFEAGPTTPGVAWSVDEQVVADIKAARSEYRADRVLTFMHWGEEYKSLPDDRQRHLARVMLDAGADVVVGGHPHVTQGAESFKNGLAVYSLGNFVFDDFMDTDDPAIKEACRISWVLRLNFDKDGLVEWDTQVARTDDQGFPQPVIGATSPRGRAGTREIGQGTTR